jgi:hypothetical protein
MILTREVKVKINQSNLNYFESLGYEANIGSIIVIPIELLSSGSHQKMSCQCDGCGVVKEVIYKNYLKYGNKWGNYYCRKCSENKRKKTLNLNFGVDYPIQNREIKKRIITSLQKKRLKEVRK